jgi:hypothetical protein
MGRKLEKSGNFATAHLGTSGLIRVAGIEFHKNFNVAKLPFSRLSN